MVYLLLVFRTDIQRQTVGVDIYGCCCLDPGRLFLPSPVTVQFLFFRFAESYYPPGRAVSLSGGFSFRQLVDLDDGGRFTGISGHPS